MAIGYTARRLIMSDFNPFFNAFNPELLGYEYAWVNFVKNQPFDESIIKKEVLHSWHRCKDMNIDPLKENLDPFLTRESLEEQIKKKEYLLSNAMPFMQMLYEFVKGSGFRVDIVDEEGTILKNIGDRDILEASYKTNSYPGCNRSEHISGTTGIGLAMILRKPFQTVGAEHYMQSFHSWVCSAAPIFDENGDIIGILNMSGRVEHAQPHTLGMVVAIAHAIENEIKLQNRNKTILQNNVQLQATLQAINDGVIYANNEGIITHANEMMEEYLNTDLDIIKNKHVDEVIKTTPSLTNVIATAKEIKDFDIILHGNDCSHNCLLNMKQIDYKKNEEIGTVYTFTKIEEIRKMANKINKLAAFYTFEHIVGASDGIREVKSLAHKATHFHHRVIIEGESGTGKEMFAQAIHNGSIRQKKPFVAIDCGAIPRELLESELFGYEEGAFTGAKRGGQQGKFEIANEGTLFLDEITNMSMEMQSKLLRVLQENRIIRVGGSTPIPIDVRIIAATNKDLLQEVANHNFREDLYYRLNVISIKIPPLRSRKEDVPLLVNQYLSSQQHFFGLKKVREDAWKLLKNYNWPGNVRQLHNVLERASIMSMDDFIKAKDLPAEIQEDHENESVDLENILTLDDHIVAYISKVLRINNGNVTKTAKLLNISRATIYNNIPRSDIAEKKGHKVN
jgi:sigma-54 dependent transcriptional regulator, acetoin dehydrogenase operon transcriptional activator AcoR